MSGDEQALGKVRQAVQRAASAAVVAAAAPFLAGWYVGLLAVVYGVGWASEAPSPFRAWGTKKPDAEILALQAELASLRQSRSCSEQIEAGLRASLDTSEQIEAGLRASLDTAREQVARLAADLDTTRQENARLRIAVGVRNSKVMS